MYKFEKSKKKFTFKNIVDLEKKKKRKKKRKRKRSKYEKVDMRK